MFLWHYLLPYISFSVSWDFICQYLTIKPEISVLLKKLSPVPMHSRVFPTFSTITLSVFSFMWGPWSNCTWILCRVINMNLLAHLYMEISRYHHTLLEMIFLPCMNFGFFVKIKCLPVYGLISGSLIQLSWSPYTNTVQFLSLLLQLEIRGGDSSRRSFIVQDCFGHPRFFFLFLCLFCFVLFFSHTKLRTVLLRSVKGIVLEFDRNCIESVYCFW